jgi:hypothetical protein
MFGASLRCDRDLVARAASRSAGSRWSRALGLVLLGCLLAALAAGGTSASVSGGVLAWGCGGGADYDQCTVPAGALSGVTAIAAGFFQSLALKAGGVLAWGCGPGGDYGQCTVPAGALSGVTAIAAGASHSLALGPASTTAVSLRTFGVSRTASGARLHWRTASETRMLGFNLYREQRGKLAKLNSALIPSVSGGTTVGRAYSWLDRGARHEATYTYRLQAVSLGGTRAWLGTAVARH